MSRFGAGLFRVVDRHFSGLINTLGNILAGIFRGAIGQAIGLFGAVRGFDRNRLCSPVYMGNGALGCF